MFTQSNTVKNLSLSFVLLATLASPSLQAEDITFAEVCSDCHTGGFRGWLSGAPNVKDKSDWSKLLERDSLEQMRDIVLNGTDDHKRKGGCKICSDDVVVNAIDYMMSLVK
ncbi:MAG: hypothetical protein GQ470_02780 [Gammaproteobacteria bacterium]|nr:hypothetical protein [Gammaproteobacteria bacterium]